MTTYYAGSHAHFVQSVGGGGGHAGTIGGIGTDDSSETWAATVAVGGAGARGGGGNVSAYMTAQDATATTFGAGAHGVLMQSVGGGGGTAANAAGQGNTASPGNSAYTTKNAKVGITLGGSSGSSGNGGGEVFGSGPVDQNTFLPPAGSGTITTNGSHAVSILAQSIGAGGGMAGEGLEAGASGSFVTLGAKNAGGAISGDGGPVRLAYDVTVKTAGAGAHGILAQSVGGGGGYAGFVQLRDPDLWGVGSALGMGGNGSQAGNGGEVFVVLDQGALVQTKGDDAVGIIAQTVGGGGGIQGSAGSGTSASVGSAGGKGLSSLIQVKFDGTTVETSGAWAHGVFLQAADQAENPLTSGFVTQVLVKTGSSIAASGIGASGIIAQRVCGTAIGENGVTVEIEKGASVSGGLGSGQAAEGKTAAVWVLDGTATNTINNSGTIAAADGSFGVAVKYSGGAKLSILNSGLIQGTFQGNVLNADTVDDADTDVATRVINQESGVIISSGVSTFDQITNSGRFDIAGVDEMGTFTHQGDLFRNTATGTVLLDLLIGEDGELANDQLTSFGRLSLDFGSTLSLSARGLSLLTVGSFFDLAIADDLFFETEADADFDLLDYVSGSFLSWGEWDLSLVNGSFGPFGSSSQADTSSFEALRLTYVASVPLPGSVLSYGPVLALFAVAGVWRRNRKRPAERALA